MKRKTLLISLGLTAIACKADPNSIVVVSATADETVPAIHQLQIALLNEGQMDTKYFPEVKTGASLKFPATFALTLSQSRSNRLDITVVGLDIESVAVAKGTGFTTIVPRGQVGLTVNLVKDATGITYDGSVDAPLGKVDSGVGTGGITSGGASGNGGITGVVETGGVTGFGGAGAGGNSISTPSMDSGRDAVFVMGMDVGQDALLSADTISDCVGLACGVDKCVGKSKTTVKGTVFDPAGRLPLYNVMVYIPNGPLEDFTEGVTCQKCDTASSGWPIASALSDAAGNFVLHDVPTGANIPVVVQSGKWRRLTKLAAVKACQENIYPGTDQFRLPRNHSEGHLPKIAFTRGGADGLECVLNRIGVDAAEFTNPSGAGRINIYYERGVGTGYDSGEAFPPIVQLLKPEVISKYDMVVFSCSGRSAYAREQPTSEKKVVKDFVDQGGRVFGSHFSYGFFRGVPGSSEEKYYQPSPWSVEVAKWNGNPEGPYTIETGFAKGKAFADWLVNVDASKTHGTIELTAVESPAASLTPGLGQAWINSNGGVPYFHISMPIEKAATPAEQCGRFVHTGIHVAQGGSHGTANEGPFPSFCGDKPLSPQEKAWEFLIFELSTCALPDNVTPQAPNLTPPSELAIRGGH